MARADPTDLKGSLEAALKRPGLDAGTRAHFDESRA